MNIKEILNYQFTIVNPTSDSIKTCDKERNKTIAEYTKKEMILYDSGTNKVEDFAKASKFWNKIANPDKTVNSAYGHLIWVKRSLGNAKYSQDQKRMTPWEWAKQCLIEDKDSRQAILRFSLPEHHWKGNKDFVCTLNGIFFIREDKLHFSIIMRSNDIVKGITYDLPWFCSLMDKMVHELKQYYPKLEKGQYTHLSHSMHAYERDEKTILKMLGK
jgi:thymidylate synthase